MKLFLTSAYATHTLLDQLVKLVSSDRIGRHNICHSAASADAILFVEDGHFNDYAYRQVQRHPLVKQFPNKTFIYTEADKPFHTLPGLYTSMPAGRFRNQEHVAFPFVRIMNQYVKHISKWQVEQDWPFSFVGAMSSNLRKSVFKLSDLSPGIRDTSEFNFWHSTPSEKASQGLFFAESMARSRFSLCPRGIGTTSFRPYESMVAGRAPVIISDNWVPPAHVNWDFAVFVRESEIANIPQLLESMKDEAIERGKAARAAWESVYAPAVIFDTAACSVEALLVTAPKHEKPAFSLNEHFNLGRVATELEMTMRDLAQKYKQTKQSAL